MGGKASKRKKYWPRDRLRINRRPSYDESAITRAFLPGDMNFPVYQPQDPDVTAHGAVWQPRRDLFTARGNVIKKDRMANVPGKSSYELQEISIKETVIDGPESDQYDTIPFTLSSPTECETDSETDLKRPEDENETMHTNKYLELGSLEKRRRRKLHRYEEMVIRFQPLIETRVIARHLIPHLTFLDDPDKVLAIADHSPRSAVSCIIDELKKNDHDPGRWKQFLEALERCGYSYIAGLLRGEIPMNHCNQKEFLKRINPALREMISPIELTQSLWSAGVISSEDKEEIERVYTNLGPLSATDRLLDRVPRKHRYWYFHLLDALKRLDMVEAAKMLDIPELHYSSGYEKPLMTQKGGVVHDKIHQDETIHRLDDTSFSSTQQRDDKNTRGAHSPKRKDIRLHIPVECHEWGINGGSSDDLHLEMDESDDADYDDCAVNNTSSLYDGSESDELLTGDFTYTLSPASGDEEPNGEVFSDKQQYIQQGLSQSLSSCTRLPHISHTEDNLSNVPDADIQQQLSQMSIPKAPVPLPTTKMLTTNEAYGREEIDFDENNGDDSYVDADDKPALVNNAEEIKETMTTYQNLESDELSTSRSSRDIRACVKVTKQADIKQQLSQTSIGEPPVPLPTTKMLTTNEACGREEIVLYEHNDVIEEYYSEPFIDEKRKTDNTLSLNTVKKCSYDSNPIKKVDDTIHQCNRDHDLLVLLKNCHKQYDVDGHNENMNTQDGITGIHPDVKPYLATVSRQQEELMVLKHQTPVLKATLGNQTEINERLKQKRTLVYEICIKNKETSALKQAIENPTIQEKDETYYTGSTSNYEDGSSSARTLIERAECRETSQRIVTRVNDEQIINKTDPNVTYKDSAFYSYRERF